MTMRFVPLAALAAIAALACTPTVAPPVLPSASPSGTAGTAASPAASQSPAPSASPTTAPTTSPAASGSPAASAKPDAHDVEGCEHTTEGPAKAVTANLVTMSRERARISDDHTRYDIALVQSAGQSEGYVIFENGKVGDFTFYLTKDVPFKVIQDGKEVALEKSSKPLGLCPDVVKAAHIVELAVGNVELHFGPTTETGVGIVIEYHAGEGGDVH